MVRILFVCNTYCSQAACWISQLSGSGYDIHLFDPYHSPLYPGLHGVTVHTGWQKEYVPAGVIVRCRYPFVRGRYFLQKRLPRLWQLIVPPSTVMLAQLIKRLQPNCIHVLYGMQKGCYVLFDSRKYLGGDLPAPWIYSSRGSDLYYYGQFNIELGKFSKNAIT